MGKMYYTEEEAAERLGIGADELAAQVRDGKLRVFQDGTKKMFRVDEVDALAGPGEEEAIPLSAAETGDAISLGEAETVEQAPKEDTVITAEGISIFDDEDLEIEEADPMAKTQIAPTLEDQIALDGVGSGSGLLDLTRESDDTSLGAEVLEHINMEEGVPSDLVPDQLSGEEPYVPQPQPAAVAAPTFVEQADPVSGLFGGMIVAAAVVMVVLVPVVLAAMLGMLPAFVEVMKNNMAMVLVGAVALVVVAAIVGLMMGKAMGQRPAAARRAGG